MNIDLTAFRSKPPTQSVHICDFVTCPLSLESTTSVFKCLLYFPINISDTRLPHSSSRFSDTRTIVLESDLVRLLEYAFSMYYIIVQPITHLTGHHSRAQDSTIRVVLLDSSNSTQLACLTAKLDNGISMQ